MPYVLSSCSKTMVQKKGEGGIVLSLQPIDDEVKLHDSEHAEALGPSQLSPQKTHQVLGYLSSVSWVAHNTSKNRSVSCSPRRDLQPKNVTPSPFQNRHHCLGRSPSFPTWQLPKDKLSSHLETRLPSWGRKRNANCQ